MVDINIPDQQDERTAQRDAHCDNCGGAIWSDQSIHMVVGVGILCRGCSEVVKPRGVLALDNQPDDSPGKGAQDG